MASVLITGANGRLGRRLIRELPEDCAIEAVVRSERARQVLLRQTGDRPKLNVHLIDPSDASALAEVVSRCDKVVHLIGIIKETRDNHYSDAHERPAKALTDAVAQAAIKHIVTISILGADLRSSSKCLRSRAILEECLFKARPPVTIIRVPMVLGGSDPASRALAKHARAKHVFLYRAASLEQPIYAGDVIGAIRNALRIKEPANQLLDLAGPESLSRRALIKRAAAIVYRNPSVHSMPLAVGLGLAHLFELFQSNPPVTREMLKLLDHDDAIDPSAAAAALGLTLTPLDEMLRHCVKKG